MSNPQNGTKLSFSLLHNPEMKCRRCQAQNATDSSFCEECGARLTLSCPACGAPVVEGKKFCRSCGATLSPSASFVSERFASLEHYTPKHLAERILSSRSALEGARKQVTVLFAALCQTSGIGVVHVSRIPAAVSR